MNKFQQELQAFRPDDEIQSYKLDKKTGFHFIGTAGHGYLVIPTTSLYANMARKIAEYGYKGKHAIYLEEDCEAGEFSQKFLRIKALPTIEAEENTTIKASDLCKKMGISFTQL